MSKEGYAITRLEDAVEISRPRGQIDLELSFSIGGTDEEIIQSASESLDADMRLLGATKVERGRMNSKQYFYAEKTWNAPWTPEGYKPPWAENPDEN